MTDRIVSETSEQERSAELTCQLCGRVAESLSRFNDLHSELQEIIRANATTSEQLSQVCRNCIVLFSRAKAQLEAHASIFAQSDHVLPTPLRLDVDERFTGLGVTIAFLDSGFYAHPDLTKPVNRIVAYKNIFDLQPVNTLEAPDVASWHGMMTSVVAAGNGNLSDGFYRGIAPEARLVLVKVGKTGRIPEVDIQRGLQWIRENREKYRIQVVNISAGGDFEQPYLLNTLCQTVEASVRDGLVVVCAVGNAGLAPGHPVLPPASSPAAISVGGLDDQNSKDRARRGMYRSSYGPTIDGLQKPELIAPGIWVAAPILPHTPTAAEAQLYSTLDAASDEELQEIIAANRGVDKDLDEARDLPTPLLRQLITIKLHEGNVINQHYKFVDGTSFAAPIVSSIAACLLQANPRLTPQEVKRILIGTAERVSGIDVERQGWGVVSPRRAVAAALELRK